jgi:hypothetical protein
LPINVSQKVAIKMNNEFCPMEEFIDSKKQSDFHNKTSEWGIKKYQLKKPLKQGQLFSLLPHLNMNRICVDYFITKSTHLENKTVKE